MEPTTVPNEVLTPPSSNETSTDELMRVLRRQHRVINNLKEQVSSVLLGLAETQASLDEAREDLAAARAELVQPNGADPHTHGE